MTVLCLPPGVLGVHVNYLLTAKAMFKTPLAKVKVAEEKCVGCGKVFKQLSKTSKIL